MGHPLVEIERINCSDGTTEYRDSHTGELHRLDGPARIRTDGAKEWYRRNKLHREDGPAIERPNGAQMWYQNGLLHRLDGPAIEWSESDHEFWIEGRFYNCTTIQNALSLWTIRQVLEV